MNQVSPKCCPSAWRISSLLSPHQYFPNAAAAPRSEAKALRRVVETADFLTVRTAVC